MEQERLKTKHETEAKQVVERAKIAAIQTPDDELTFLRNSRIPKFETKSAQSPLVKIPNMHTTQEGLDEDNANPAYQEEYVDDGLQRAHQNLVRKVEEKKNENRIKFQSTDS